MLSRYFDIGNFKTADNKLTGSQLIDEQDACKIVMSLASGRKEKGFSESEVKKILDWAHNVKLEYFLLEMMLDGVLLVDMENDDVEDKEDLTFIAAKNALTKEELDEHKECFSRIGEDE